MRLVHGLPVDTGLTLSSCSEMTVQFSFLEFALPKSWCLRSLFFNLWNKTTLFFCLFFFLFRVAPSAYGSSQARGQIGAAVAGLHHSHSSTGSEPCL